MTDVRPALTHRDGVEERLELVPNSDTPAFWGKSGALPQELGIPGEGYKPTAYNKNGIP